MLTYARRCLKKLEVASGSFEQLRAAGLSGGVLVVGSSRDKGISIENYDILKENWDDFQWDEGSSQLAIENKPSDGANELSEEVMDRLSKCSVDIGKGLKAQRPELIG
eukprot:12284499-Alexandrium_andersonii.AAC.1